MAEQLDLWNDTAEYDAFVEKFKPKKTTDDCYTPQNVYEAVKAYAVDRYSIRKDVDIYRPFYPGGDYERFDYSSGGIVIDNPPFSILSKIIDFYNSREIKFFLFAPALTIISTTSSRCSAICCGASVTYANGAKVATSFATNMESEKVRIMSAPKLFKIVEGANKVNERMIHAQFPKYEYPDNVVTSAFVNTLSKYGVEFSISADECIKIRGLDAQKANGKVVFGGGYLVSEKAAAEKAAAEKAAAEKAAAEKTNAIFWELSEREKKIVQSLGKDRVD